MTTEEQREAWFKKYDMWIVIALVAVIPILFTLGLFWIELENRVEDVNESRAELTYIGCLEQNERHDNASKAVNRIFGLALEQGQDPDLAARKATQTVLDALAPKRDCQAVVKARFGFVPAVPEFDNVPEDS